jgi:hypothetical protein
MIFCKSRKSAERTLTNILPFIEGKLFLKVNREKTEAAHISKVKFLGYGFYRCKGKCRLRTHPKSVKKMKDRIRQLTSRNNGWGNEFRAMKLAQFIRGWVNYFKMADMKMLLMEIDEWLRRKIRAIFWKQWKKVKTRYRMIRKYGIPEEKAHEMANCRKGIWRAALMLNNVLTNKEIVSFGFMTMTDYYLKVRVNQGTAVYRTVRTVVWEVGHSINGWPPTRFLGEFPQTPFFGGVPPRTPPFLGLRPRPRPVGEEGRGRRGRHVVKSSGGSHAD